MRPRRAQQCEGGFVGFREAHELHRATGERREQEDGSPQAKARRKLASNQKQHLAGVWRQRVSASLVSGRGKTTWALKPGQHTTITSGKMDKVSIRVLNLVQYRLCHHLDLNADRVQVQRPWFSAQ
jgi:hypothetical protein